MHLIMRCCVIINKTLWWCGCRQPLVQGKVLPLLAAMGVCEGGWDGRHAQR